MIDDKGHRLVADVLRKVGNPFFSEDTIIEEAKWVLKQIGLAPDAPHICSHRYGSLPAVNFEGDDRQGIKLAADSRGRVTLRGINSDFETILTAYANPTEWLSIERREL